MQIDLREIEALHARYAREPVVIDLENQIRAIPAPLMLPHKPVRMLSLPRRAWNARWQIGRVSLTVIGGTVVCSALGMGVGRVWPALRNHTPPAQPAPVAKPASAQPPAALAASTPPVAIQPLNSQALESTPRGTPGLAVVDPSSLVLAGSHAPSPASAQAAAMADEQKAIASPIRQRALPATPASTAATVTAQAVPVEPTSQASAAPPRAASPSQPARTVRHLVHLRPSAPRDVPPAPADAQKAAAAPAPRSGDVQLF